MTSTSTPGSAHAAGCRRPEASRARRRRRRRSVTFGRRVGTLHHADRGRGAALTVDVGDEDALVGPAAGLPTCPPRSTSAVSTASPPGPRGPSATTAAARARSPSPPRSSERGDEAGSRRTIADDRPADGARRPRSSGLDAGSLGSGRRRRHGGRRNRALPRHSRHAPTTSASSISTDRVAQPLVVVGERDRPGPVERRSRSPSRTRDGAAATPRSTTPPTRRRTPGSRAPRPGVHRAVAEHRPAAPAAAAAGPSGPRRRAAPRPAGQRPRPAGSRPGSRRARGPGGPSSRTRSSCSPSATSSAGRRGIGALDARDRALAAPRGSARPSDRAARRRGCSRRSRSRSTHARRLARARAAGGRRQARCGRRRDRRW